MSHVLGSTRRPPDAFISYSHRGERDLARSLEKTLWTFGRRWYQIRGLATYRDETNLSAEPDLWPTIEREVQRSRCLVLLASPESARSEWVPREVDAAVKVHGISGLCIVQTAGVLPWTDRISGSEMLQRDDGALGPSVWQHFDTAKAQPLVVDLRSFRSIVEKRRRNDPEYLSRVAAIAAKALGKDKETIWGEYHRAQRLRTIFLGTVSALLMGLVVALGLVLRSEQEQRRIAIEERGNAERQLRMSESIRLAMSSETESDQHPQRSVLLAMEAARLVREHGEYPPVQAYRALWRALHRIGGEGLLAPGRKPVHATAVSPNSRWLLVASSRARQASLWDIAQPASARTPISLRFPPPDTSTSGIKGKKKGRKVVSMAKFSADSHRLIVILEHDPRVFIWNITTQGVDGPVILSGYSSNITDVFVDQDTDSHRIVAVGDDSRELAIWDTNDPRNPKRYRFRRAIFKGIVDSKTSRFVAVQVAHPNAVVLLAPMGDDGRVTESLVARGGTDARFTPDGRWLFVDEPRRSRVRLWSLDTDDGHPLHRGTIRYESNDGVQIACSPDGTRLAVASTKGSTAWLADVGSTPLRIQKFSYPRLSYLHHLDFSADSRWLSIAGEGNSSVFVWDLHGVSVGNPILLGGHRGESIRHVLFSSDSRWLVTNGSTDPNVRLWDLQNLLSNNSPVALSIGDAHVRELELSDDARWLAGYAFRRKEIVVWELPSGHFGAPMSTRVLTGHDNEIASVTFTKNGHWLLSVGQGEDSVRVWNVASDRWRSQPTMLNGSSDIKVIDVSPDARWLAVGDGEDVMMWDLKQPELGQPRQVARYPFSVGAVRFCTENRLISGGALAGDIRIFNLGAGGDRGVEQVIPSAVGGVSQIECTRNGRWAAIKGDKDGVVQVIAFGSMEDESPRTRSLAQHDGRISTMQFDPEIGRWLVTAGAGDDQLFLWDLNIGVDRMVPVPLPGLDGGFSRAAFSPDSEWIMASADSTSKVLAWNLRSDNPVGASMPSTLGDGNMASASIAFAGDGKRVALTQSGDGPVEIWERGTSNQWLRLPLDVGTLNGNSGQVLWSGSGGWMAIAGTDGKAPDPVPVSLWNMAHVGDTPYYELRGLGGTQFRTGGFSPDGRWFGGVGNGDSKALLWSTISANPGQLPVEFDREDGDVKEIRFSSDGRWLIEVGRESVDLWKLDLPDLLKEARRVVGRTFTEDETLQYFPEGAVDRTAHGAQ